jgi:hypothetical protein
VDGDKIKIDHMETGLEGVDWFYLLQNRNQCRGLVNTVINRKVPEKEENFFIT